MGVNPLSNGVEEVERHEDISSDTNHSNFLAEVLFGVVSGGAGVGIYSYAVSEGASERDAGGMGFLVALTIFLALSQTFKPRVAKD